MVNVLAAFVGKEVHMLDHFILSVVASIVANFISYCARKWSEGKKKNI